MCALAVALAMSVAACSGGGKKKGGADTSTTKPSPALAVSTAVLKVGKVDVESAGPQDAQVDKDTAKAVLTAAQAYIDDAIFAPLKTFKLGAGYGALFDKGVRNDATGPDRAALTELAVGKVPSFTTKATPVELSALFGTLGELQYVATNFKLTLQTRGGQGRLVITHEIELTFAKTGKTWLVTAYRVQTVRKTPKGATTTTTAKAGSTP